MLGSINWDDECFALEVAPRRKPLRRRQQQRGPRGGRRKPRVSGQLLRMPVPDEEDREEFCEALEEVLADLEGGLGRTGGGPGPLTTHAGATREWEGLQRSFLKENENRLLWELGWSAQLTPIYPETAVQQRFLKAGGAVLPAYHGTQRRNIASISRQGLLLPGHHGVRVANGNAHGRGIYTARLGGATLSQGFCDSNDMFVCAVKDAAAGAEERPPPAWASVGKVVRGHRVWQKSATVLHVGSAMVVRDEDHIVPLFLANVPSLGRRREPWAPPTVPAHMVGRMQRYWSMSTEEKRVRRHQDQRVRTKWMRRERSAAWEDDCCSDDSAGSVAAWEDDSCSCDSAEAAPQGSAAQVSRASQHGRCEAPADLRQMHPLRRQLLPHLTGGRGRGRDVADAQREPDSLARLAGDIVSDLRGSPMKLVELASGRQHARRYNGLAHGGRRTNDGSFSSWLRTIPGVQVPGSILSPDTPVSWAHAGGARRG